MLIFLVNFVDLLFTAINLAILARIILAWLRMDPYHPIVQLLYQITEPVLAPFRRFIPPIGMIDISPIVALLVLQIARRLVITMLVGLF